MIKCYFGLPGCGKSTILTAIAQRELKRKRYHYVYTNFYCHGCIRLNMDDLGEKDFSQSLIIIDEITLEFDSRNFKSFSEKFKKFFTLHRHDRSDIIYATQYYNNVDKRIRDLTAENYYVRRIGPISIAMMCPFSIIFPSDTGDILFGWTKPELFTRKEFYIRALYYKKFDSYAMDRGRDDPVRHVWGSGR